MDWAQVTKEGVVVRVRVTPRASRSRLDGLHGDALKVRLAAPPVDGKANAALVEFLAETWELPRRSVQILAGETSRDKRVLLVGLSGPPRL